MRGDAGRGSGEGLLIFVLVPFVPVPIEPLLICLLPRCTCRTRIDDFFFGLACRELVYAILDNSICSCPWLCGIGMDLSDIGMDIFRAA